MPSRRTILASVAAGVSAGCIERAAFASTGTSEDDHGVDLATCGQSEEQSCAAAGIPTDLGSLPGQHVETQERLQEEAVVRRDAEGLLVHGTVSSVSKDACRELVVSSAGVDEGTFSLVVENRVPPGFSGNCPEDVAFNYYRARPQDVGSDVDRVTVEHVSANGETTLSGTVALE